MERTLFLGSYGFHNYGDELCLLEARRLYPDSEHWTQSANPAYTARCTGITNYIGARQHIKKLQPTRVVIGGGGVGFLPSIRDHLHWALDAVEGGAKLHIHNIGVAATTIEDRSWLIPSIKSLIDGAVEFTVRDVVSREIAKQWTGRSPELTFYPEVNLGVGYFSDLDILPKERPLLGISVTNQSLTLSALRRNPAPLHDALAEFTGHLVVPVVSCLHPTSPEEDDVDGYLAFKELLLDGFDFFEDQFLDKEYIKTFYSPAFLRALIARLDVLFAQRKHNCIHAIGAGTRVFGFSDAIDDSIKRVFDACESRIPKGSALIRL